MTLRSIIGNRLYEYNNNFKKESINKNLLECYNRILKKDNMNTIIKHHKQFITNMDLTGKKENKYKTVRYLEQYKNTKNKEDALSVLTNTLINKSLFSI